jgi:hypothetical protein
MTARSNRRPGLLVAGATALGIAGTALLATARATPPTTATIAVTSSTSTTLGRAGEAAGGGPDEPAAATVTPPAVQPARPVPARPRYTG